MQTMLTKKAVLYSSEVLWISEQWPLILGSSVAIQCVIFPKTVNKGVKASSSKVSFSNANFLKVSFLKASSPKASFSKLSEFVESEFLESEFLESKFPS
jgi:hypothetical protein